MDTTGMSHLKITVQPDTPQMTDAFCMLHNEGYTHTHTHTHTFALSLSLPLSLSLSLSLRIRNTYSLPTATMVTRTGPIVTLYLRLLSYQVIQQGSVTDRVN